MCKCLVPVLIGLARSMGRFAYEGPPLLCRIFPRPEPPIPECKTECHPLPAKKQHSFCNFRSIIPRSLSGDLNPRLSTGTGQTSFPQANESNSAKRPLLKSYLSVPYDPAHYFFNRYGSSFNQFPQMRCNESTQGKMGLQFSVVHLQSVLALAKKLLTKETLSFLDEEAQQVFIYIL